MGTKEDESSTGCIWAAGFHHVMAHSCLKLMNHLFLQFSKFLPGHSKPWITETTDNEFVDTGVCLYCYNCIPHHVNKLWMTTSLYMQNSIFQLKSV
jgi:hypothetical protein